MATGTPFQDLAARLRKVPTATAKEILRQLGVTRVAMQGIRPMVNVHGSFAGPARTLRYLPLREDFAKPPNGAINRRLIDAIGQGEVLVSDAMGCTQGAILGDMLATRAHYRGAAGVVADGVIRDLAGHAEVGLPVFARGTDPDPSGAALFPWEMDTAIQCGGVLVLPGDWILADQDSVLVIPPKLVNELMRRAETALIKDEFCQKLLASGFPLDNAYPLPKELEPDLERYKETGILPSLQEAASRRQGQH